MKDDELRENIEHWVHAKNEITNVPNENVYDVATEMDSESNNKHAAKVIEGKSELDQK